MSEAERRAVTVVEGVRCDTVVEQAVIWVQVSCSSCGHRHCTRQSLVHGTVYRFRCKRCGSVVCFEMGGVRWLFVPVRVQNSPRRELSRFQQVADR